MAALRDVHGRFAARPRSELSPAYRRRLERAEARGQSLATARGHGTAARPAWQTDALVGSQQYERALDDTFQSELWRQLPTLVLVDPHDDVLPVRARYGATQAWQIGLNVLEESEPMWWTLADCIASTLLTGRPPRILAAERLVPVGRQDGLRPVALRNEVTVDPVQEDFFRRVIEARKSLPANLPVKERQRLGDFLKVLANSSSYGVFAELNRQETGAKNGQRVTVHGLCDEPFLATVSGPEEPGDFSFPPLAAIVAGAARLMLALLERCVTDLGGTYLCCDTDSMAIIATESGGLVPSPGGPRRSRRKPVIRALSRAEVNGIVDRFAGLNPYDPNAIPGPVLEIEQENFARCGIGEHKPDCTCTRTRRQLYGLAISAKRYALFNLDETGEPNLRKWSEHGLGHLLNPTDPGSDDRDWLRQVWDGLVREELGRPYTWPGWLERPAISRLTISSPELLRHFQELNAAKTYPDQVKPFNFLLAAHVKPFGHPDGVDPVRFQLFAPFEADARSWESLPWGDRYSGLPYRITTTAPTGEPGMARVHTYRDVLDDFRYHPEAKSADAEGRPSGRQTTGLLQRQRVRTRPELLTYVGKESNKLEEVEAGLGHDPDEVWTACADPRRSAWQTLVLPVLKQMTARELAVETRLSERAINALRNGRASPRLRNKDALLRVAATFARHHIRAHGLEAPADDLAACAALVGPGPWSVQDRH